MNKKLLVALWAALLMIMSVHATENVSPGNLSHSQNDNSLQESVSRIRAKVIERGDLPYITVDSQLEIIDALQQFNLGRFLLERGGLNGRWTKYWITHPFNGRVTGLNDEGQPFSEMESFLLNRSPTFLSSQERFVIFSREMQSRLFEGCSLASLPCGLMADLLNLDFSSLSEYSLIGLDVDPESIELAWQEALKCNLQTHTTCVLQDAWQMDISEAFDILTSNGLAFYEPNDDKVIELYQRFYKSLKPGGYLITSYLTHPPGANAASEWRLDQINADDTLLQKIIFGDILECKWQIYRSTQQIEQQLRTAGFEDIEIIYDTRGIFPTVVARKAI